MRRHYAFIAVAFLLSSCGPHWGGWDDGPLTSFNRSEPLQNETVLEAYIDIPIGQLEIQTASSANLYELDLEYNDRMFKPEVEFERRGDTAVLRFRLNGEGKSVRRMGKTRLNLRFNPSVPLVLKTTTGVGQSEIDLGGMKVRKLDLQSGVGETIVTMLSPNPVTCDEVNIESGVGSLEMTGLGNLGFRRFRFEGGVGGSKLDFSGEWKEEGDVDIEVGVGGVKLLLPRSVGAEVRASKSFMSSVDLPDFEKRGETYFSYNLERVSKVLRLNIQAGIGGVDLRWI
jgi:hypothetical protein